MPAFAVEDVEAGANDQSGSQPRPEIWPVAPDDKAEKGGPNQRGIAEGGNDGGGRQAQGANEAEVADGTGQPTCPKSGWTSMTSTTTVDLEGVWGSSSKDVFAVGQSGTIVEVDETARGGEDSAGQGVRGRTSLRHKG